MDYPCTIREPKGCTGNSDPDASGCTGLHVCLPCSIVRAERALSALYAIRNSRDLSHSQRHCARCAHPYPISHLDAARHCPPCADASRAWERETATDIDKLLGL